MKQLSTRAGSRLALVVPDHVDDAPAPLGIIEQLDRIDPAPLGALVARRASRLISAPHVGDVAEAVDAPAGLDLVEWVLGKERRGVLAIVVEAHAELLRTALFVDP